MSDEIQLSIVLPARNEERSLRHLLPELRAEFPEAEIIIVDDGSTDATAAVAEENGCRTIRHPFSMGNGAAIKRGAREAKGRWLALMDADGQHLPRHLVQLVEQMHSGDYDMVIGARSGKHHASRGRRLANLIFNRLASWMTNADIKDLTSGLRLAKTDRFREFLFLLPNSFSYPTTSTMAFLRSGYPVVFVPVDVQDRHAESDSHIRPMRDGARFILTILKIGSLYSPFRLFLPISVFLFASGFGLYIYNYATNERFTNMSALLLTTSLLTFLIGMVSEQITALMFARRDK